MIEWENLTITFEIGYMRRAKVPGGWLVMVTMDSGVGVTFYPDPQHLWDGNSLP